MAATLRTKKAIQAWCDANGVTLSEEVSKVDENGVAVNAVSFSRIQQKHYHVHLDITGEAHTVFRSLAIHNANVWDSNERPDWKAIGAEIAGLDLDTCDIENCEYCEGEQA